MKFFGRRALHPRMRRAPEMGNEPVNSGARSRPIDLPSGLRGIGKESFDPPAGWLFHERWKKTGRCPGIASRWIGPRWVDGPPRGATNVRERSVGFS